MGLGCIHQPATLILLGTKARIFPSPTSHLILLGTTRNFQCSCTSTNNASSLTAVQSTVLGSHPVAGSCSDDGQVVLSGQHWPPWHAVPSAQNALPPVSHQRRVHSSPFPEQP